MLHAVSYLRTKLLYPFSIKMALNCQSSALALLVLCLAGMFCTSSAAHTWNSVPDTWIGRAPFNRATTYSFDIPSVIPATAHEVLIYARMYSGRSGVHQDLNIKIFTQIGRTRYEKYMFVALFPQDALTTSTDNMWFPMPTNHRIYVNIPVRRYNSGEVYLSAIGYR
jgi:hypothetical protein